MGVSMTRLLYAPSALDRVRCLKLVKCFRSGPTLLSPSGAKEHVCRAMAGKSHPKCKTGEWYHSMEYSIPKQAEKKSLKFLPT